eukprot:scaffold9477_cov84-Skeletonema_dohrnii-CCMP3373.AAC.2
MEKVLSVAGWCLASGVISNEQYASIVQRIFSEHFVDTSDLVFCISDLAVTCVVAEDLELEDELVFLKCENLYEIIAVPAVFEVVVLTRHSYSASFSCLNFLASFKFDTNMDDKEEEETAHCNHDGTIMTTANEHGQVVVVTEEQEQEGNGSSGMWVSENEKGGWDTKGVEAGRDNILCKNSGIGGSNGGVIFSKYQDQGGDQGQGYDGSTDVPDEYQMEPKVLFKSSSTARGEGGMPFSVGGDGDGYVCLGLGEEEHEVTSGKVMPEAEGKWINAGSSLCVSGSGVGVYSNGGGGGGDADKDSSLGLDYNTNNEFDSIESEKNGISVKKTVVRPKLKMKGDSIQLCGVSRRGWGTTDENRESGLNDGPGDSQAYTSTLRNGVGNKLGEKAKTKIGSGKERELEDEAFVCGLRSVVMSYLEVFLRALRLPSSMDQSMLWSVNIGILVVSIGKWLSISDEMPKVKSPAFVLKMWRTCTHLTFTVLLVTVAVMGNRKRLLAFKGYVVSVQLVSFMATIVQMLGIVSPMALTTWNPVIRRNIPLTKMLITLPVENSMLPIQNFAHATLQLILRIHRQQTIAFILCATMLLAAMTVTLPLIP